jgi:putative intracellular protease/amidase
MRSSSHTPPYHPTHPALLQTKNRLGELAEPYWVLKDGGYDITIASPAGGAVPIDDASLQGDFKTPECDRMMADGGCKAAAAAAMAGRAFGCQHPIV